MKRSRTWLGWLAVWLLALSCAGPAALSVGEAGEAEGPGRSTRWQMEHGRFDPTLVT